MQKTKLRLPFNGEWLVFWGGDTKKLNAHHDNQVQKYAFDFVIVDEDNASHTGDGTKNSDYLCFKQKVLAPAAGEVVEAIDGVRDNTPGDINQYFLPGNYVLIKHSERLFSSIAHLLKGSVAVKVGDRVKAEQKLGLCGNSGNSSEPHLHYHLQDSFIFARYNDNYDRIEIAKGIKASFSDLELVQGDKTSVKKAYSPIKGDTVSPILK